MISSLRRELPAVIGVDPDGSKESRARGAAPQVEAGNVHLPGAPNADVTGPDPTATPDWAKHLIDECASFPNAAHDDQVDALSQALRRLAGHGPPTKQKDTGNTVFGGLLHKRL